MNCKEFGRLRYSPKESLWIGRRRFPRFTEFGLHRYDREDAPADEVALQAMLRHAEIGLDELKDRLTEAVGEDLMAQLDEAMHQELADAERQWELEDAGDAEEEAKRRAQREQRFSKATFEILIEDSTGEGPSPEQKRAFQWLLDHEETVWKAVIKGMKKYYRQLRKELPDWFKGYPATRSGDELKEMIRLTDLLISHYHLDGHAYIVFFFDCIWEIENYGVGVLCLKDRVLDVSPEADQAIEEADNWEEEHDLDLAVQGELIAALKAGDERRVNQLVAQGADVGAAMDDASCPLLLLAAQSGDVEQVRTFLELGADPQARTVFGKTILQMAEEVLQFMEAEHSSPLQRVMKQIAERMDQQNHEEMLEPMREIVRLMRDAAKRT